MRALIIGPDEKAAIQKLADFASEKENWYKPGRTRTIPGDDPNFVVHVPDGFRCVFTWTKNQGQLYRHLTVSIPSEKYPSPEACVTLAKEFGFTASDDGLDITLRMTHDGWMTSMGHAGEHCIVVVQPIEDKRSAA